MSTNRDLTLPGLELQTPDPTPIERAALAQLQHLDSQQLLGPQHGILRQLVLDLARGVGVAARGGKGAALALASRELREALLQLPSAPEADDPWTQFQRELQRENGAQL